MMVMLNFCGQPTRENKTKCKKPTSKQKSIQKSMYMGLFQERGHYKNTHSDIIDNFCLFPPKNVIQK